MKILYLDCSMGAAGDMLSASLFELLSEDEKTNFLNLINSCGIPKVLVKTEKSEKCGVTGTHFSVKIDGEEEGEDAHHTHHHEHHEHHHHSSMSEIQDIVKNLKLSENVKNKILDIYKIIANAESEVHGVPVTDIHFHEVGKLDAICDVACVCALLEIINPEKVYASNVHVGSGQVHCAHGILPVPAPATALILKGVPIYGGKIQGELCTPTGAALLKYFVNDFGPMPVMKVEKYGYGMGKKDFEAANCVRSTLGLTNENANEIVEFTCNLDDMSAEKIGFATEQLFEAGAVEVYTIPVFMKKNRPGNLLCVMCKKTDKEKVLGTIFKHTTTIGIRENISNRYVLNRKLETISTEFGQVQVKVSEGYGIKRKKLEYEDLAKIARENNLSLEEVERKILNK